jgi:hypothetical protein
MKVTMKLDERSMKGPRRTGKRYPGPRTFADKLIDAIFPEIEERPSSAPEPAPKPEAEAGPEPAMRLLILSSLSS